jgi:signal peptide peptidase SppA
MRIIDVLTSPWAIVPEKLFEIQEIYRTHLRGDKIDIEAIEAQTGKPLDNKKERYQIVNDTAIIPIQGVIAKKMNLFTQISGGASTHLVGRDIKEALADDSIKSILLDIDSPGGTVDGTQELGDIVFAGRDKKPIIAYSDGMIASAAYWIGSAADKIYISGDTIDIGSIGVVASHVDYSEWEKKVGIKTTEIYAGKYKRIASDTKPLSKEGKQYIQDQVDYLYSIFVDQVAKNRGVSSEKVLKDMADGRIFIGKQAITAGLVDGVSTLDRLINTVLPVLQADKQEAKVLSELNNSFRKELSNYGHD